MVRIYPNWMLNKTLCHILARHIQVPFLKVFWYVTCARSDHTCGIRQKANKWSTVQLRLPSVSSHKAAASNNVFWINNVRNFLTWSMTWNYSHYNSINILTLILCHETQVNKKVCHQRSGWYAILLCSYLKGVAQQIFSGTHKMRDLMRLTYTFPKTWIIKDKFTALQLWWIHNWFERWNWSASSLEKEMEGIGFEIIFYENICMLCMDFKSYNGIRTS